MDPFNRAGPIWGLGVYLISSTEAQEAFYYLDFIIHLLARGCAQWILVIPASRCIEKALLGLAPASQWRLVGILSPLHMVSHILLPRTGCQVAMQ